MAAATMYVTVAGAGTKLGNDWDNAMDLAAWKTDLTSGAEAGDIYYVLSGTYGLTATFGPTRSGTGAAPIKIIGVSDEALTRATGTDRPHISCGAYYWVLRGHFNWFYNIRWTGTSTGVCYVDGRHFYENCYAYNSGAAGRAAFYALDHNPTFVNCEAVSTNGYAFLSTSYFAVYINCYAHDSDYGFYITNYTNVVGCIIDTCASYGIRLSINDRITILNNTFYACDVAIGGSTGDSICIIGNIIDSSTATFAIHWTTTVKGVYLDYNNYHGNVNDILGVTKGINATALNPQFADAPNKDFRIGNASLKGVIANMASELGLHADSVNAETPGALQQRGAGGGGETSHTFGL